MANVTISPNMNLTIPTTGVEIGPDWANDLNNSVSVIDSHNHAPGSGVQINPNGIDINSDLSWNNTNNATDLRSLRFSPQLTPISSVSPDLGCLYEAGVDLYYNDGAGNQIRLTQSGSVAGAAGTITGLPSGTASAAYVSSSGTFVFQQATSTAANLDIGTIVLRYPGSYPTPAGDYIAIEAPSSLSGGYSLVLPATTPGAGGAFLTSDTSGVLSYTNVDNSSLDISSATLEVKNLGISTAKIADGAVTLVKTAAVGQITSSSSGGVNIPAGGGYVQVLTLSITTIGRPVMLMIQPDGASTAGGSPAQILFNSLGTTNVTGRVAISRDGGVAPYISEKNYVYTIGSGVAGDTFACDASSVMIDIPSAGTHTYTVYCNNAASSTFMTFFNYKLVAYEI